MRASSEISHGKHDKYQRGASLGRTPVAVGQFRKKRVRPYHFALVVLAVRLVVPADNVGMATFATVRESFRTLIEKRRDIKSVRVSERG